MWPVDTTAFKQRVKLKKVFDVYFEENQPLIAVADSHNRIKVTDLKDAQDWGIVFVDSPC